MVNNGPIWSIAQPPGGHAAMVPTSPVAGGVQPVQLQVVVPGAEPALDGGLELATSRMLLEFVVVQMEEEPPGYTGGANLLLDCTWGEEVDLLLDHQDLKDWVCVGVGVCLRRAWEVNCGSLALIRAMRTGRLVWQSQS